MIASSYTDHSDLNPAHLDLLNSFECFSCVYLSRSCDVGRIEDLTLLCSN